MEELFGPASGIEDELILEYVRAGNPRRAKEIFAAMRRKTNGIGNPCVNTIASCAVMGHREDTLKILEARFQERADLMVALRTNEMYASLRSDPRFQDLLNRIGN